MEFFIHTEIKQQQQQQIPVDGQKWISSCWINFFFSHRFNEQWMTERNARMIFFSMAKSNDQIAISYSHGHKRIVFNFNQQHPGRKKVHFKLYLAK